MFDGRYVYFVPDTAGVVARYDTQSPFGSVAAWTFSNSVSNGFAGSAFDGRYVYFAPNLSGTVTRFDAKTPPSMPASFNGSFY